MDGENDAIPVDVTQFIQALIVLLDPSGKWRFILKTFNKNHGLYYTNTDCFTRPFGHMKIHTKNFS